MDRTESQLVARIATDPQDLSGAARLRYEVFVEELGGDGPLVEHDHRFERDKFDPYCRHLVLIDTTCDPASLSHVVGVYRLLENSGAEELGQFYSEDEYDLTVLKNSGRKLLELGRSCLHPDYRGGLGMYRMWSALAEFVESEGIEILFGVASFHGNDVDAIAPALSLLHHRNLAPSELRVKALPGVFQRMDLIPIEEIDKPAAIRAVPSLIKAYLRLGGMVGEGAYIDREFNTIDVCLIVDVSKVNARMAGIYGGAAF